MRMKSQYSTLEDALLDSRVPLRSDDEFRVGVTFTAKVFMSLRQQILDFFY